MQASVKESPEQGIQIFPLLAETTTWLLGQSAQHKSEIQNSTLTFTQNFPLRVQLSVHFSSYRY